MKYYFIPFTLLIFSFFSCVSPEQDGIRIAKQYFNCDIKLLEYREKEYSKLIKNFNAYNFVSRFAVREELEKIDANALLVYNSYLDKAKENYNQKKLTYSTNQEKIKEFEFAFNAYLKSCSINLANLNTLQSEINDLIFTIIPPIPDLEKIKHDLQWFEVYETPSIYFNKNRRFVIETDKIIEIEIIESEKVSNEYLYRIYLVFISGNSAYETVLSLRYSLGSFDDWQIISSAIQSHKIIITGKYSNLISSRIIGWQGERELEFFNSSDFPLLIGGYIFLEFRREWRPFSLVVEGKSKNSVGGLFFGSVSNYRIDFVERP